MGAGRPERSAIGTKQKQGIRSRLPARVRQQQTEPMSAAARRSGTPGGRAAAAGSQRGLSTGRCGRVVALYEGAPRQRGCIGGHVWRTFSVANGGRSRERCQIGVRRCVGIYNRIRRGVIPQVGRIPGSAETRTTLGPIPIALARAAGQTPGNLPQHVAAHPNRLSLVSRSAVLLI
jgi:hypothetical protein